MMKHCVSVVLAALVAFPAMAQEKAAAPTTVAPKVLQTEGGRFVFGQVSDWRADQFMLDTKTGRLWQVVMRTDDKGEQIGRGLQAIPYINPIDERISVEPKP
jgi:hypothetical protein